MCRIWRSGTAVVAVLIALCCAGQAGAKNTNFAFQPIKVQRIDLPRNIRWARFPGFTHDGHHLLFWNEGDVWITGLRGQGTRCLTCGLKNRPKIDDPYQLATMLTPFPDGRRVLLEQDNQVATTQLAVLECTPSVADCATRRLVPIDYAAAEPTAIAPGGALLAPQIGLPNVAAHAQLAPDGRHVGFSQARSDSVEAMIVARLDRPTNDTYTLSDPRVINPAGPSSPSDTGLAGWSDSSSLFEFKTFTNGGADATYVQVGGASTNTDIWSVNLATGRRTRLTSHPDWDEDNAGSPDGKLMTIYSTRTMHYTDWLGGLLPVRDFVWAPVSAMSSSIGGNTACMGPMWLLPGTGDQGAALSGQPIVEYRYPGVHVVDTLAESAQWSADGTMIALDATDDRTGRAPPYLLVAHLTANRASRPLRTVSSQPGAWAVKPQDYHGAIGYSGDVTLPGPGGGSVTVHYGSTTGALSGSWSETYNNYTENGDVVNGTVAATGGAASDGSLSSHLTMTGRHTGRADIELTFSRGIHGHAKVTYDGVAVEGPSKAEANSKVSGGPSTACPSLLPKKPALKATATRLSGGRYRVTVTASVADTGSNEGATATSPVRHATIAGAGGTKAYTNAQGVATVRGSGRFTVTAGDTLLPASVRLAR
ncbi:TolB family protein [Conexibacter woesei]|uniref:TolB family protein n=1 Tax=Conexibacter woesei TaxID=191495 RepID=UPI000422C7EF|nr:hypothetical protein [Conexibacter woesei]